MVSTEEATRFRSKGSCCGPVPESIINKKTSTLALIFHLYAPAISPPLHRPLSKANKMFLGPTVRGRVEGLPGFAATPRLHWDGKLMNHKSGKPE